MFTLNNPQPEENPRLWPAEYCIWQLERGEEGTPHYQGYIIFKTNKTPHAVKLINPRAHWELRVGTHEGARNYCSKEDTRVDGPWTFGEEPKQGKRTDLLLLKERLDSGVPVKELWADPDTFPVLSKYDRVPALYRLATIPQRRFKTHVLVLHGPPGLGKSYFPATVYPDAYYKNNTQWWDGYEHQKVVVFDDFTSGWFKFTFLLQVLDRYPLNVQVKGGTVPFNSKLIIITSNRSPDLWYKAEKYDYRALERRLTTIYRFRHDGPPVLEKGKPIRFNWLRCHEIPIDDDFDYDADIPADYVADVPEGPPSPSPSSVVFDDDVEYIDHQDGERILRPNYRPNPAAPGSSRDAKRYRDK